MSDPAQSSRPSHCKKSFQVAVDLNATSLKKRLRMIFKRSFFKSALQKYHKMTAFYPGEEKPMHEIRRHLLKFTGGSVSLVKRDDGLALIILSQEKKKNAMTGKMMVDLYDAVEELSSWTAGKGVILKGSGGNFCSGGDLDFVRQVGTSEEGFMMSVYMHNILNKFQRLPLVSVALIEGIGALGGGSELSVACDFTLASETCKGIGFVHGKMGILPAWGGTNRLVQKIGYANALEALTSAKIFSPKECLNVGLVDHTRPNTLNLYCGPFANHYRIHWGDAKEAVQGHHGAQIIPGNENNEEFAISWLRKKTQFDANLARTIKTMVSSARDFPGDYETERRLFAPFWGGPAHKEALRQNIKHVPRPEE